jgi:hypothetical protein
MSGETQASVAANARTTPWPKISLVTPVRNSAHYLEATIRSVLSQQYPNLEYIIIDGGSTDGTQDIIHKYESQLHAWASEPDQGMYDAINKGFARSSGEIMGWINASDLLHVNSLFVVGSVFQTFPRAQWITGRPSILNQEGMAVGVLRLRRWARYRFLAGANRYIQQESTLWRRSLWEQAGGKLELSWGLTGDFELWVRFFRYAKLYPVDALIGGYRTHADAQGLQNLDPCHRTHDQIIEKELASLPGARSVKLFRALNARAQRMPGLAKPWTKLAIGALRACPGADLPPVIRYRDHQWVLEGS